MELWDLLYLLNVLCVWISWRLAMRSFNEENQIGGYANLFASALNAAILMYHFI
jgi:hypothetical protein